MQLGPCESGAHHGEFAESQWMSYYLQAVFPIVRTPQAPIISSCVLHARNGKFGPCEFVHV